MDVSIAGEAAPHLTGDDKAYYVVPPNCIQFKEKPNNRRILIIKNSTLSHYRKYKSRDDSTIFHCWGCYVEHGLHVIATYLNGTVKAPRLHSCEWIPLEMKEKIKKIKLETNDAADSNPSSSSVTLAASIPPESSTIVFENPCQETSSNLADDSQNRPRLLENDVIELENSELEAENKDSISSAAKIQALKKGSAYRTVGPNDYEKAYSSGGVRGHRLIIFEENDKSHVRQYARTNRAYWFCVGCFKNKRTRNGAFCENNDETFAVPKEHICEAITYAKAKEEQKQIIEKWGIDENEEDGSGDGNDDSENQEDKSDKDSDSDNDEQISHPLQRRTKQRRQSKSPSYFTNEKREVKEGEYFLGVGAKGQTNGRIHVFVEDDKSLCHEYRKMNKTSYFCHGCYEKGKPRKIRRIAILRDGVVLVPYDHICEPLQYADVEEEQKAIKEKYAASTTRSHSQSAEISSLVATSTVTPPPQPTPVYYGARLTRMSSSSSSSPIPTSSKTLIHKRQKTPYPLIQERQKKKLVRSKKNLASPAKVSLPTETESELLHSNASVEKTEKLTPRIPPQLAFLSNYFADSRSIAASMNKDKSELQILNNSTTSSTISIAVNHPLSTRQNGLSTSKPKTSDFSITKSSDTISTTTPAPPLLISSTPTSALSRSITPTILSSTISSATILSTVTSNLSTETLKLYKPSQYFLEKCCEKLSIPYSNDAYKLWSTIAIDKILPSSIPDQVYTTNEEKYHGWECISLYLTGSEQKVAYIREKINEHLYFENTKNTIPVDREAEGRILFSETATESHFQAISKWFNCRIGIFSGGEWKRYGNWAATDDDIPILLMKEKDAKLYPIMSLK